VATAEQHQPHTWGNGNHVDSLLHTTTSLSQSNLHAGCGSRAIIVTVTVTGCHGQTVCLCCISSTGQEMVHLTAQLSSGVSLPHHIMYRVYGPGTSVTGLASCSHSQSVLQATGHTGLQPDHSHTTCTTRTLAIIDKLHSLLCRDHVYPGTGLASVIVSTAKPTALRPRVGNSNIV